MKFKTTIFLLLAMILGIPMFAAEVEEFNKITWDLKSVADLPAGKGKDIQHGLAGAYSGVLKDGNENDVLILAGGANFPLKPLVDAKREGVAPKKIYHDDIFMLVKSTDKQGNLSQIWKRAETKLPYGMAYGQTVAIDGAQNL